MGKIVILVLFILGILMMNACETINRPEVKSENPFNMVEKYYLPDKRVMELKTIKVWEGKESQKIKFDAPKTPWVLNTGYKQTSAISSFYDVSIYDDSKQWGDLRIGPIVAFSRSTGIGSSLVENKGSFTIEVESSGCQWWIKIGVEQ